MDFGSSSDYRGEGCAIRMARFFLRLALTCLVLIIACLIGFNAMNEKPVVTGRPLTFGDFFMPYQQKFLAGLLIIGFLSLVLAIIFRIWSNLD
ncbi:MAG: hypothetical protein V7641_433 [Blastocatellia bacterium]